MSKISDIKDLLIDKIKKLSEKANAEEIEKLSGALAHLDMIDRFDMSKIYEALNNKDGTLAIGAEK